jgi:hypothetical protein
MNWYAYVGNNPMTNIDPTGLAGAARLVSDAGTIAITDVLADTYVRPSEPLPQTVLPPSPKGEFTACNFRTLLSYAETAARENFSKSELLALRQIALAQGLMERDYTVPLKDANAIMKLGFDYIGGQPDKHPVLNDDPTGAVASRIRLQRDVPVYGYETPTLFGKIGVVPQLHFQEGNSAGELVWDPWGRDLSGNYESRSIRYVHY